MNIFTYLTNLKWAVEKAPAEKRRDLYFAFDSVNWYVCSGRAYADWEKALCKAKPEKLLAYIANPKRDQSTTGQIQSTEKYLKRYCGLKTE